MHKIYLILLKELAVLSDTFRINNDEEISYWTDHIDQLLEGTGEVLGEGIEGVNDLIIKMLV